MQLDQISLHHDRSGNSITTLRFVADSVMKRRCCYVSFCQVLWHYNLFSDCFFGWPLFNVRHKPRLAKMNYCFNSVSVWGTRSSTQGVSPKGTSMICFQIIPSIIKKKKVFILRHAPFIQPCFSTNEKIIISHATKSWETAIHRFSWSLRVRSEKLNAASGHSLRLLMERTVVQGGRRYDGGWVERYGGSKKSSDECVFLYRINSTYIIYVCISMDIRYIYIYYSIFQKRFIELSKEYTNKSKYVSRNEKAGFMERSHHQKMQRGWRIESSASPKAQRFHLLIMNFGIQKSTWSKVQRFNLSIRTASKNHQESYESCCHLTGHEMCFTKPHFV